jgi:hypothetical protein
MADKILGILVWQGARLYARRRFKRYRRQALFAGLGAVVLAGVVMAGREATRSS